MNNLISGHFDKKVRFIDTRCDGNFKEISFPDRVASLDLSCGESFSKACIMNNINKFTFTKHCQLKECSVGYKINQKHFFNFKLQK